MTGRRCSAFWGFPNLQVINRDVHAAKCVDEAKYRRGRADALRESADTL